MIEIKSDFTLIKESNGSHSKVFTLIMTRDGISFNVSSEINDEQCGEHIMEILTDGVFQLTHHLYPEMRDPLVQAKLRLKRLQETLEALKYEIRRLEDKK